MPGRIRPLYPYPKTDFWTRLKKKVNNWIGGPYHKRSVYVGMVWGAVLSASIIWAAADFFECDDKGNGKKAPDNRAGKECRWQQKKITDAFNATRSDSPNIKIVDTFKWARKNSERGHIEACKSY